ncbi:hypothetical protein BgiMline_013800 [Biomphalaria glabrata]
MFRFIKFRTNRAIHSENIITNTTVWSQIFESHSVCATTCDSTTDNSVALYRHRVGAGISSLVLEIRVTDK